MPFSPGVQGEEGWYTQLTALEDVLILNAFGWNINFLISKLPLPYSQTFFFTCEGIWTSDPWYKASSYTSSMTEGMDLSFQKEDQIQVVCRWSCGLQWPSRRDNVTFSLFYNSWGSFNLNVQSLCNTITITTCMLLNVFLNNFITGCVSHSN